MSRTYSKVTCHYCLNIKKREEADSKQDTNQLIDFSILKSIRSLIHRKIMEMSSEELETLIVSCDAIELTDTKYDIMLAPIAKSLAEYEKEIRSMSQGLG